MKKNHPFPIKIGEIVYLEPRGNYARRTGSGSGILAEDEIREFPVQLKKAVVSSIGRKYFYASCESREVKVNMATFLSVEPDCNASYAVWPDEQTPKKCWETAEKRRVLAAMLKKGYSAYRPMEADESDYAVQDEMVEKLWNVFTGKREFYVDTPLGKLHVYAKHEGVDCAEDYPGVYIDAPEAPDGSRNLLACTEFCPDAEAKEGYIQTCVYQVLVEEPVNVTRHFIPTKEDEEAYQQEVEAEAEANIG